MKRYTTIFAILHFYGGGVSYERLKQLPGWQIDAAVKFMNEEKQREAERARKQSGM